MLEAGATVDLARILATAVAVVSGQLVAASGGVVVDTLSLSGDTARLSFTLVADGAGGTDISVSSAGSDASHAAVPAHPAALIQAAAGLTGRGAAALQAKITTWPWSEAGPHAESRQHRHH